MLWHATDCHNQNPGITYHAVVHDFVPVFAGNNPEQHGYPVWSCLKVCLSESVYMEKRGGSKSMPVGSSSKLKQTAEAWKKNMRERQGEMHSRLLEGPSGRWVSAHWTLCVCGSCCGTASPRCNNIHYYDVVIHWLQMKHAILNRLDNHSQVWLMWPVCLIANDFDRMPKRPL